MEKNSISNLNKGNGRSHKRSFKKSLSNYFKETLTEFLKVLVTLPILVLSFWIILKINPNFGEIVVKEQVAQQDIVDKKDTKDKASEFETELAEETTPSTSEIERESDILDEFFKERENQEKEQKSQELLENPKEVPEGLKPQGGKFVSIPPIPMDAIGIRPGTDGRVIGVPPAKAVNKDIE